MINVCMYRLVPEVGPDVLVLLAERLVAPLLAQQVPNTHGYT